MENKEIKTYNNIFVDNDNVRVHGEPSSEGLKIVYKMLVNKYRKELERRLNEEKEDCKIN